MHLSKITRLRRVTLIGQELSAAFELFQYNRAATIIIAIFLIVLIMELLTDQLRKRVA